MPRKKLDDEIRIKILQRLEAKDFENYKELAKEYGVSVGIISNLNLYNGYTKDEYLQLARSSIRWLLEFFTKHVEEINVSDEEIEKIGEIESEFS